MNQFSSDTFSLPANHDRQPDAAAQARAKLAALHSSQAEAAIPVSPLQEQHLAKQPLLLPQSSTNHTTDRRRSLPSHFKPVMTAVAVFALLVIIFKLPIILTQLSYLTKTKPEPMTLNQVQVVETVPPEPIMQIAKISVNAPVVYASSTAEPAIQQALQSGIVHYATTARPGEPGNSVFVGHSSNDWWEPGNYKFVFVLLDKLAPGDTFSINYNSRKYIYQVTTVKVVEPTDLSVLAPTPEPTATLITCTPPGTNWKRLIVQGKQISPDPSLASTTSNTAQTSNEPSFLPGTAPSFLDQIGKVWNNFKKALGWKGSEVPAPASQSLPSS